MVEWIIQLSAFERAQGTKYTSLHPANQSAKQPNRQTLTGGGGVLIDVELGFRK